MFDAAKAQGLRSGENPAAWRGNLSHDLPRRKKDEVTHHPALAYEAIPEFFQKLRARESISALALEFCVLTAARSGEVRGAAWQEINLDDRIWTVPASRMKGKREHRVPLSDPALAVLRHVEPLRTTGGPIFPGRRTGKPLAQAALRQALEAAGIAGKSVHGMRSAFRDWCGDATDFPREVAEGCLAHAVGNEVELAYRRSSALEKRRGLMEAWAAFCEPKEGSNDAAHLKQCE